MLKSIFSITLASMAIMLNSSPLQAKPKLLTVNKNLENKEVFLLAQINSNIYQPPSFAVRRPGQAMLGAEPSALVVGIRGHFYGSVGSNGLTLTNYYYYLNRENEAKNRPRWYDTIEITIKKNSGAGNVDHVVQIYDVINEVDYKMLYMYPGGKATVDISPGTYEIKYAVGKNWVSEEELFGSDTSYFKLEKTIVSEEDITSKTTFSLLLHTIVNPNSPNAVAQNKITAEEFEPPQKTANN